jgi:hypothetical protein
MLFLGLVQQLPENIQEGEVDSGHEPEAVPSKHHANHVLLKPVITVTGIWPAAGGLYNVLRSAPQLLRD